MDMICMRAPRGWLLCLVSSLALFAACGPSPAAQPSQAASHGGLQTRGEALSCASPPTFAGLASAVSAEASSCGTQLTWSAATASCGGAITYSVYRDVSQGFTPGPANRIAAGLTDTGFTDVAKLQDGQTYWYAVRATETTDTALEETNTLQRPARVTGPTAPAIRYFDDLDGNRPPDADAYWSASGPDLSIVDTADAGTTSSPTHSRQLGTPACSGFYCPDTDVTLVLGGDGSAAGVNGFVMPARIARATLSFWQAGYLEEGYDFENFSVGTTGPGGPFTVYDTWTATLSPQSIDLSSAGLEGETVWLYWRFVTDSIVQYPSPHFDDFRFEVDEDLGCSAFDPPPGTPVTFTLSGLPATVSAGTPVTLTLTALDSSGAPLAGYGGPANLASTDPNVSLPSPVSFIDGQAAVEFNFVTAGPQSLTVSDGASPEVSASASTTVLPGPPVGLTFLSQPASATAGSLLAPVEVALGDAYGNTVTTSSADVSLALSDSGGGTLEGTLTKSLSAGVARFGDLSLERAAIGYRLTATATGWEPVTSAPFDIVAGPADHAAFTVPPGDAIVGAAIVPAVSVATFDAFGNLVETPTTVMIALGPNSEGAALRGTTSQVTSAGVAAFPELSINRQGQGYTLLAAPEGLPAVQSAPFDIAGAGPANLSFFSGPAPRLVAGVPFGVQVAVEDALGNPVMGGPTLAVTLSLQGGSATLSGDTTVEMVDGVATFSGLSVDQVGSAFTLEATAAGLFATSAPFWVVGGPASTLTVEIGGPVKLGKPATVTITAYDGLGNIAKDEQRTVGFSSSDPRAQLPAPVALYDGRAQASVVFGSSGAQTLTVADVQEASVAGSPSVTVAAVAEPTVVLLNPAAGATVTGKVQVIASASVGAGTSVARLSILLDGQELATGSGPVLSETWDTSKVDAGKPHTLTAKVTDQAGNSASSAALTVQVAAAEGGGCSAAGSGSGGLLIGLLFLLPIWRRRPSAPDVLSSP
jgi:hypothetical protein